MFTQKQIKFRDDLLSPWKQRLYYLKSLPMGLVSGIKLIHLDEERSITEVPFRWCNKNPFNSMYFAVLSMAAELSTAVPVMMVLKGDDDTDIALIIVDIKAEFVKRARSTVTFECGDYLGIVNAVSELKHSGATSTVTMKTIGRDANHSEVAIFYFTWSFKRRR